jgi:hypothetical protein
MQNKATAKALALMFAPLSGQSFSRIVHINKAVRTASPEKTQNRRRPEGRWAKFGPQTIFRQNIRLSRPTEFVPES